MADAVFTPPLPGTVRINPVRDGKTWQAMREACAADPGAFHGAVAARNIHWFHPGSNAWLTQTDDGAWTGFDAATGAAVTLGGAWTPWDKAFDDSDAPIYRWFSGGLTNAAFNEVDRHVLAGHGAEVAYWYEGDRWDADANGGTGGPVHHRTLTRRDLFVQSVIAAVALRTLGLGKGDCIAFNMPNILDQIVWTEATKRLGVIYTPVFGGFSDKTLSDRIENAGARVVITADGASRNAEVVPFKEAYTDPALDRFVAFPDALRTLRAVAEDKAGHGIAAELLAAAEAALKGEITVAPADVMRAVGRVLDKPGLLDAEAAATLRADIAEALAATKRRIDHVVVVRHAHLPDMPWTEGRDLWAHDLLAEAAKVVGNVDGLDGADLAAALWKACPPEPVDAEFPLFIMYTSGSTGKPKGVVHVHGGYVSGLIETMKVSFDAVPGEDVMYVVADPGWITGQSYLITAALAHRIPGIVTEGAPVFPNAGRFSNILERHGCTIFKAGATFLKSIMTHPLDREDVAKADMGKVKVATFCAEPTSPAVQQFAMDLITPQYINSYWATEHGGIVWTHPYGNADQPLRADAHTWPLPWVMGDVWLPEGEHDLNGRVGFRPAEDGEKGEIVVTAPYPYLARTIWGHPEGVGSPAWKGDADRWTQTYYGRFRDLGGVPQWAYLQGDFAVRYEDGSYTLHGRSDDVINVSGHRMGTEEIEGAILKDKAVNPDSPVGNCIVIGAPHRDKGLTPVAFVLPAKGRTLTMDDERRLKDLVRAEKGAVAVPSDFIAVSAFPETRSGKYMRRFLKALMLDEPLGDTSTLRNPEIMPEIETAITAWKRGQARADAQRVIETTRSLRVQYDTVAEGRVVATLTIGNPPVNALSERVLDELDTTIAHLGRRADVRAVVICGQGNRTFVAGADIRQMQDEVNSVEEARALPAKAHRVFDAIERLGKPVVAAVQGVALGGGCELAMACHLRIGDARTRMGQPEVNLFLPPGYGGTQRLPRLLAAKDPERGVGDALRILLSGRQVDARAAMRLGLLDYVCVGSEDPVSVAQAMARMAAAGKGGPAHDALTARLEAVAEWEKPGTVPDVDVQPLLDQAESVGRGVVARAIVDLVRRGLSEGFSAGLKAERDAFARLLLDAEHGARKGIALFLDKKSPPLPARPRPEFTPEEAERLGVLPVGSPFIPGVDALPEWQWAWGAVRDATTGAARHGDPKDAEVRALIPVPEPTSNQALVYVLASEINYNDIWALTGIPISLFDEHDEDVHVTGSGGVGMVVRLGEGLQAEGRLSVGQLVSVYSGVSDLLDPRAGADPMFTNFHIQGYQSPDGSHQQFMLADGPQLFPLVPDLDLEAAGSYMLTAGTAYRALFTTLGVRPGKRLFVEGAATGTGAFCLELGLAARLAVTGMVSSEDRAEAVEALGAAAINRRDRELTNRFTRVPVDPVEVIDWEAKGGHWVESIRKRNDGHLVDYAVSHAGETAFPRTFQALAPGGVLTFYGASSGYHMTFLGKEGSAEAADMLHRAALRPGEAVVVFYGTGTHQRDNTALAAIEAARAGGGRIVAVTDTDAERDFILSLGFGDAVLGAVSLAEIKRRHPHFSWPDTMPDLPDPQAETAAFKETVRRFTEDTFKPLGQAVGKFLRSSANPRGTPDIVVERAHVDTLAWSTMLVSPEAGRVVYIGDMAPRGRARRYSFYAPQVWMRQRRIYMPTAGIFGSHLSNAAEMIGLNRMIAGGTLRVPQPYLGAWDDLPGLHQAMWENRLREVTNGAANAVVNHALPEPGLRSRDELIAAWAAGRG